MNPVYDKNLSPVARLILMAMIDNNETMSIRQLALSLGLSPSTIHRRLYELASKDYVSSTSTSSYTLYKKEKNKSRGGETVRKMSTVEDIAQDQSHQTAPMDCTQNEYSVRKMSTPTVRKMSTVYSERVHPDVCENDTPRPNVRTSMNIFISLYRHHIGKKYHPKVSSKKESDDWKAMERLLRTYDPTRLELYMTRYLQKPPSWPPDLIPSVHNMEKNLENYVDKEGCGQKKKKWEELADELETKPKK